MKEITITQKKYGDIATQLIGMAETKEEFIIAMQAYLRLESILFSGRTIEEIKRIEKGEEI